MTIKTDARAQVPAAQIVGPKFELVLVSCSATKRQTESAAGELYCSQLFKASKRWAIENGDRWAILSARYGIVWPSEIISPYDQSLQSIGADEVRSWGFRVQASLCRLAAEYGRPVRTAVLAGRDYTAPLRSVGAIEFVEPLAGLGIGKRLQWLKNN